MMKRELKQTTTKKEKKSEENFSVCKCFGPVGIHS
jgi:hypothetical protein